MTTDSIQLPDYASQLRTALPSLPEKDRDFAANLLRGYDRWNSFTDKQLYWVKRLLQGGSKAVKLVANMVPFAVMFQFAKQHLRRPRIRLVTDDGVRFYVYPAAETSKNAGWFYVKETGGGTYFGKIEPKTGEFVKSAECPDNVLSTLNKFAADPQQAATGYGHLTNTCCFCGQTLTDSVSVKLGYGPICAGHYGLQWGDK
jgi:hypothetical protein